ncbi:MAG: hypothetical protein ACW99G_12595 [Candidatus Thorarchaeota archaeon]|jgi:hypothetical protein
MKTINVTFTDEEHGALLQAKDKLSWHDFIIAIENLRSLFLTSYKFIESNDLLSSFSDHLIVAGLDVIDEDILVWIEGERVNE